MSDKKSIVSDVFSKVSKRYDLFLGGVTFGRINKWQLELLSYVGSVEKLLDVGTGTGEVLLKAKQAKTKVGLDISLGMLKVAKKKCDQCHFLLGDAENLPIKEDTFDGITLSLVYRHLLDRSQFLKEAHRILKKGGKVAILDINRFFLTDLLALMMKSIFKPLGVLLFGKDKWDFFIHSLENSLSVAQVTRELESFGFRKIRESKRMMGLVYILVFET